MGAGRRRPRRRHCWRSGSRAPSRAQAGRDAVQGAWIYVGPHNDGGWSQAHEQGRLYVQKMLGSKVQTTYKENIAVGAQFAQTVQGLVSQGYKLIFATSYGYLNKAFVAKYPNVLFEQATGTDVAPNLSEYFGAAEDTVFLSGHGRGGCVEDRQHRLRRRVSDPRGDPACERVRARCAADASGRDRPARVDELVV